MAKNDLVLSRGLKFGIELEIVAPNMYVSITDVRVLLKKVVKCKVNGANYTHEVSNNWKVVTDSSLTGNAFEVVSPPLVGFEGLADVEKVVKVLNDEGFKVNKSCGFHVHHEVKDLGHKALENTYRIYDKYEKAVIQKLLPKSRSTAIWCTALSKKANQVNRGITIMDRVNKSKTLEEFLHNVGECHINRSNVRYHSLNLNSYIKYGTLEFRHHSGTLDFEKIKNWILLTHKIIEVGATKKVIRAVSESRKAKWDEEVRHSSFDFYKELGINGTELSEYLGNRRKEIAKAN